MTDPTDETLAAETLPSDDATPAPPGTRRARPLDRGDLVGRYVVLRKLGAGGMGVVYAAYDPELDRKLAIKLLLPDTSGQGKTDGRTRLLREAQALAKLDHPNVVSIHDVGTFEDRVFLAMEFVEGATLGQWLNEEDRGWPAILTMFRGAGIGLAAAHDKGLVHRDFKPDNVMVGDDGRVRVMDFGLARAADEKQAAPVDDTDARLKPGRDALAENLTRAGSVMGTPAYMAPEQHLGVSTDARTDQFSFCVALWEAVYGQRPFAGETIHALALQVTEGKLRAPPRDKRVPGWLHAVCTRGLDPDPDRRFASMNDLLAAFERGRARARTNALLGGTLALVLVGGGMVGYQRVDESQRVAACEAEGDAIDEVWNDATREQLRTGILATGLSYAELTAEKALPYFDAQAKAIRDATTQACLDARVHQLWTEDLVDRSRWCLQERTLALSALATELANADETSVQKAVGAAAGLSSVDPCQDANQLARMPAPPVNRDAVSAARTMLSQAGALDAAGRYAESLEVAKRATEAARAADWPPILAAAKWREGRQLDDIGQYSEAEAALEEAYFVAARAGASELSADAASSLIFTVGTREGRPTEAKRWFHHAEVALAAAGQREDGLRWATTLANVASVHRVAGEYEQAKRLHERALAIYESVQGPEHPNVAVGLNSLAVVHQALGDYAEAEELYQRALALREQLLGPEHPDMAIPLTGLATVHYATGDYARAKAVHERVLSLREAVLGLDHPEVAQSLTNLANVLSATGDYAQARAMLERAAAIFEKALGPDDLSLAQTLANLATVQQAMHDYDEAKVQYERALNSIERKLGPEHPAVATVLNNIASVEQARGDYDEAERLYARALSIQESVGGGDHEHVATALANLALMSRIKGDYEDARKKYERAVAIYEKALGPEHPDVAYALTGLATVALAQQHPAEALGLAQRAVRLREKASAPAEDLANSRFVLATALAEVPSDQGRDHTRAIALARQARDGFASVEGAAQDVAEVDAWLTKHADDG